MPSADCMILTQLGPQLHVGTARLHAMANWEAARWHEREAEIARKQQAKAALIADALQLREAQVGGSSACMLALPTQQEVTSGACEAEKDV